MAAVIGLLVAHAQADDWEESVNAAMAWAQAEVAYEHGAVSVEDVVWAICVTEWPRATAVRYPGHWEASRQALVETPRVRRHGDARYQVPSRVVASRFRCRDDGVAVYADVGWALVSGGRPIGDPSSASAIVPALAGCVGAPYETVGEAIVAMTASAAGGFGLVTSTAYVGLDIGPRSPDCLARDAAVFAVSTYNTRLRRALGLDP